MTASTLISIVMIVSELGASIKAHVFEWIDLSAILAEHSGRDGE